MRIHPLGIPDRFFGQPLPVAPDMNQVVDKIDELVAAVNAGLTTSNALVGGPKFVRYRSSALYGLTPADLTLNSLDPDSILPGNEAVVLNPADSPTQQTVPPQRYVAILAAASDPGAVSVPATTGSQDRVFITWQEADEASSDYSPLLASELNQNKADYAGLGLRPLLIKLVNQLNTATSTTVLTPVAPTPSPAPTVTGFLPDSAVVGTSITITGTNLLKAKAVTFNGTPASFQVVNATTIQAVVPVGATTGPISVSTAAGTGTSAASFTVLASGGATTPPPTTYPATQQSYTATTSDYATKCGKAAPSGYVGPTRTSSAGSASTQAAADAQALAVATQAAKDAIVCVISPPTYEWTLTGPSDEDATGVTLTTDGGPYKLGYNRIFNGDSTAKRMDITTPGGQQVAVDFPASYLGQGFTLTVGSTIYGGTYTDGVPSLTTY